MVITLAALDAPLRLPDALDDVVEDEFVRLVRGGGASSKGGGGVEQHDRGAPPGGKLALLLGLARQVEGWVVCVVKAVWLWICGGIDDDEHRRSFLC